MECECTAISLQSDKYRGEGQQLRATYQHKTRCTPKIYQQLTGTLNVKSYMSEPCLMIFSSPVGMYRKSYCTTPSIGAGVDKMLKIYVKVFYVMGKVLSDKLSCVWKGLIIQT